jgi:hypothetical protein
VASQPVREDEGIQVVNLHLVVFGGGDWRRVWCGWLFGFLWSLSRKTEWQSKHVFCLLYVSVHPCVTSGGASLPFRVRQDGGCVRASDEIS